MSVQFGRWSFEGEQPTPIYLDKVRDCIAPYGPDSNESYSAPGVRILYRAFHTTKEARREKQPHICASGAVITWDGRLDNRDELIDELKPQVTVEDGDVTYVAAAFERWGTDCFAKLVGDWALSIWNPRYRSLMLVKDCIGPRHLYYSLDDKQVTWCTLLDPLVLFGEKTLKLCEKYIAGWLYLYPAAHRTPYVGINSVPPASCVFLGPRKHIIAKYWDFDAKKKVLYRTDGEYEEHFRALFFKAVRRRLRSDAPVVAELSGGRDSSSIVCVADEIMGDGQGDAPRLDTISYYNDSEPTWNERPYFELVEKKRGREGWHIDISGEVARSNQAVLRDISVGFVATPSSLVCPPRQITECLLIGGNRVLLSGIGGDEVTGGVPTPIPEVQDLLLAGQIKELAHRLKLWALEKRKPWFYLLFEAAREFLPTQLTEASKWKAAMPWIHPAFAKQHWPELRGFPSRIRIFGPVPTFQHNLALLDGLRRQIASRAPQVRPPFDKSYPFLDRDLLQFLFAIPRQQLVRPGQRRSLMRRALAGVVPDAILNRKGKAFVARGPLLQISQNWRALSDITENMAAEALGILDGSLLYQALQQAMTGQDVTARSVLRAVFLERWLRSLPFLEPTSVRSNSWLQNTSIMAESQQSLS